jgi:hypothetical protein
MLLMTREHETMTQFYTFNRIVAKIQSVILERVKRDVHSSLHFHGLIYGVVLYRQLVHKRLTFGKPRGRREKFAVEASTEMDKHSEKKKDIQVAAKNPLSKGS